MSRRRLRTRVFVVLALALAIGLALFASPYASSAPDGLNKVAESKGFLDDGRLHRFQDSSPIPGYAFPGIDDPRIAKGLAGFVGTLLVASLSTGVLLFVRRRRPLVG